MVSTLRGGTKMSYSVQVFIGIREVDFCEFQTFMENLYAQNNKQLNFRFLPYIKEPPSEEGVYEALMPDQRSWILLIANANFESDEEINFNLYTYTIGFQGFKDKHYSIDHVKEEGHWLFNKLKEIGKYELLLLYDMQKVADRFSPPKGHSEIAPI